ncbi:MAG: hypothetical protein RLZZ203_1830 [Cyanobacteriota bacterium]
MQTFKGLVNPKTIDYIIVSHTEPDHSGLVEDVLQLAPRTTVLASKVALQFLEGLPNLREYLVLTVGVGKL